MTPTTENTSISNDPVIEALYGARHQGLRHDDLDAWTKDLSDEELAEALDHLEVVARWSREARGHVATELARSLHGSSARLEAYDVAITAGRLERGDWQHEEIGEAIAKSVTPKQPQAAKKLVKAICEAAGIGYWRTKHLAGFGINPDTVSSQHRGRPSVTVTRRQTD